MKLALATALCVLAVNSANAFAPSAQVGSSFVGSVQVQSRDVGERFCTPLSPCQTAPLSFCALEIFCNRLSLSILKNGMKQPS